MLFKAKYSSQVVDSFKSGPWENVFLEVPLILKIICILLTLQLYNSSATGFESLVYKLLTFYSTACKFITPEINLFTEDEKCIIIDNTYYLRDLNSKFTKSSNENKRRLQYKAASKVLGLNIDAHMLSKKYSGNHQSKYDSILNRSYALTEALNSGSSLCIEGENTETKLSMTSLNNCRCS